MSPINLEQFLEKCAETLKIKNKESLSSPLKNVPEYDSMGKISISLLIEDLFGFQIEYEILDTQETITTLFHFCKNRISGPQNESR